MFLPCQCSSIFFSHGLTPTHRSSCLSGQNNFRQSGCFFLFLLLVMIFAWVKKSDKEETIGARLFFQRRRRRRNRSWFSLLPLAKILQIRNKPTPSDGPDDPVRLLAAFSAENFQGNDPATMLGQGFSKGWSISRTLDGGKARMQTGRVDEEEMHLTPNPSCVNPKRENID